ncbi:hypothetical protein MES5069_680032 [Mesorhizobium escarrei]|uniref:Uncharacterized protein n=1 Tax=Mesorhizobium escarrei TaxID=666018 RepID=A0ABM9EG17_9HYPH|nr:hypothetical protein MES5069_680032 [Mesorhizobium escarrei]
MLEHLDVRPHQSINLGGQDDNPVKIDSKLEVMRRETE